MFINKILPSLKTSVILFIILTLFMSCIFYFKRDVSFDIFSEAGILSIINVAKHNINNEGIKYGIRLMFETGHVQNPGVHIKDTYRIYEDASLYGSMIPYNSQIGLHGWLFYIFTKYIYKNSLSILRIICCLLLSLILTLICYELYKKYGILLSLSFYIVSISSSWLRNFSTNLYFVIFTYFIPMLLGLLCLNNLKKRARFYLLFFIIILIKSACGYEYLPVIMLSSIMFLLVELINYFFKKDIKQSKLLLKTIFYIGFYSLLGFASAFIIHSYMRGDGNILAGIKSIYHYDALRRTVGIGGVGGETPDGLNISTLNILWIYLNNYTTGRYSLILLVLFLLCILIDKLKNLHYILNKDLYLFIVSFITCISWFILGKQHSFIHTHINYVLWYMGFIQIGTYVILKFIFKICYYNHRDKLLTIGKTFIYELREDIIKKD